MDLLKPSGVQRARQVQALLPAHPPDDDSGRPHPQRSLDQPTLLYLTGALHTLLPALHGHHVGPQLLRAGSHRSFEQCVRGSAAVADVGVPRKGKDRNPVPGQGAGGWQNQEAVGLG
jgi:hypothetical protein